MRSNLSLSDCAFRLSWHLWPRFPRLFGPGSATDFTESIRRRTEHDFVTIAPDGKSIAYLAPSEAGVANIWVEDLFTHQHHAVTRAGHRGIAEYQWTYDSNHLLFHSDENGNLPGG